MTIEEMFEKQLQKEYEDFFYNYEHECYPGTMDITEESEVRCLEDFKAQADWILLTDVVTESKAFKEAVEKIIDNFEA